MAVLNSHPSVIPLNVKVRGLHFLMKRQGITKKLEGKIQSYTAYGELILVQ